MQIEQLLRSYVNNEKLNIDINEDDLKLLKEQALQTLIYPLTNNKEYKKYYISWVLKQEQLFELQEGITNLFNENSINHIYFKGAVLAKLYDDPSVRTRGDIDLYVNTTDLDKTKSLLIENGFIQDSTTSDCMHHIGFTKNNIEVEVHFNMFDPDCDKSWLKLFKDPFSLAQKKEKSLYEFDDTYHFTYCILHFAHHLRAGAGIRYMLDNFYIFKKSSINFELLHNILKECKMYRLYGNIINALRMIFNEDFDNTISKEDVQFFIDYMLKSGIHGYANAKSHQSTIHTNKMKFFIYKLFMIQKEYRLSMHPILGKYWALYPICLIYHWCYLLTHKLGAFFKFIFGKNNNKKLYKKLGI